MKMKTSPHKPTNPNYNHCGVEDQKALGQWERNGEENQLLKNSRK